MKPIPIIGKGGGEREPTAEEFLAIQKQRHEQRLQWAFLTFLAIGALAFLVPLGLWLSRIALGG